MHGTTQRVRAAAAAAALSAPSFDRLHRRQPTPLPLAGNDNDDISASSFSQQKKETANLLMQTEQRFRKTKALNLITILEHQWTTSIH